MGPEMSLLMAAGGTGLGIAGQQQAADEQRSILDRAQRRASKMQSDSMQKILNEAGTMAPTGRADAMATQADKNYQQTQADLTGGAALDGSGNAIIDTAGDAGAVSSEFMKRKADSALAEGARMSAIARELAKTRSSGDVMRAENQRRAAVTGDVNSLWSSTKNMNNAAMQDAESVQQPWYGQLGKIGLALAGQMAGQGGGGRISFTG